jgi:glutathione S-transferase
MKIYGDPKSTNTRKVLTTLAELELPYELVHVDFAGGEHKHPSHVKRQPFGQMPALEDEGFVLYESHAMLRYLDAKAGGRLLPSDLQKRARVDQWMSIESANFAPYAMKFVYHYLLRVEQDAATLARSAAAIDHALGVLGQELDASPYLGGQALSLADICYMPYFEYVLLTPAKEHFAKHPSTLSWWDRVKERASWGKVTGRSAAA